MPGRVLIILLAGVVVGAGIVTAVVWQRPTPKPAAPAEVAPDVPVPEPIKPALKPGGARGTAGTTGRDPSPTPTSVTPDAALGTLIIESDVPETSVFIDRVYLGNAPVTARNLMPGTHHINMSVTGYDGVSEDIEVKAGTHAFSMKFKEIRLDEKIDVTHKHGIGSCSGMLHATPQRLTYVTTHTGDAFTIALTRLDLFEMNYVEKNLRVKVRAGKTYNFAAADGDANKLYQFHQTVEKVRQRLLAGRQP